MTFGGLVFLFIRLFFFFEGGTPTGAQGLNSYLSAFRDHSWWWLGVCLGNHLDCWVLNEVSCLQSMYLTHCTTFVAPVPLLPVDVANQGRSVLLRSASWSDLSDGQRQKTPPPNHSWEGLGAALSWLKLT